MGFLKQFHSINGTAVTFSDLSSLLFFTLYVLFVKLLSLIYKSYLQWKDGDRVSLPPADRTIYVLWYSVFKFFERIYFIRLGSRTTFTNKLTAIPIFNISLSLAPFIQLASQWLLVITVFQSILPNILLCSF